MIIIIAGQPVASLIETEMFLFPPRSHCQCVYLPLIFFHTDLCHSFEEAIVWRPQVLLVIIISIVFSLPYSQDGYLVPPVAETLPVGMPRNCTVRRWNSLQRKEPLFKGRPWQQQNMNLERKIKHHKKSATYLISGWLSGLTQGNMYALNQVFSPPTSIGRDRYPK